jgi:hypothetical protein
MLRSRSLTPLLTGTTLWLAACATSATDDAKITQDRDLALETLQQQAGAPVTLEVGETGDVRVLAMTPRFSVPGHATDPAIVAQDFLATHHDVFQLSAADATQFIVTRVDHDRAGDINHVILDRVWNGIPVFQGEISIHMDAGNGVFRALGNDSYRIAAPTNRMMLSPEEAALAAGRALGVAISPVLTSSDGQHTVFDAAGTLAPIRVDQKIVHVAQGDDRFAYQTTVSWLDDQRQQQYQLALIDAQDGSLLGNYSLVNTFTGRVFNVNAQATANMTTDTRSVESFDGNPAASPIGWVGTARKTVGNNAVACTDLDRNNACGAAEIQPTADAADSFDFPFDPLQNASNFKDASVANAFFLVNDWHDRTYLLGFTEAAGNFQTDNFGKGGAQADEVQVDAQDASGTNNANFATPPDGSKPRMQMFLFTLNGGPTEDGDFDPTVIYHENTHGLSNRLVGGGATTCLRQLQSGGMGEGWSDFVAATFLDNPVIGAYVTGNATVGIRQFSMDNSPLTYDDIKNGTLNEVHAVGELWAATLWDIRNGVGGVGGLGAAKIEQLVVSGMKLTPCNPSMINARDAILNADQQINNGANRCAIFAAFAHRLMGDGASSPTDASTTTIVTSSAVPPECGGGGGGNQAPTVTITSPTDGSTVRRTITVAATATDADGTVVSVRFDLPDGTSVTDTAAPFSTKFNTRLVPNGSAVFKATATDNQGATSTTSVTVTVAN